MPLNDELISHSIATVKLGAGFGKSVNPYLDEMKAIVRRRVAGFDGERRTAARLTAMLDKMAAELEKPAGEWLKQLKQDLKQFARYESKYQAETIGDWVNVNMTEPTVRQVWAAAKFNPVGAGASTQDFISMMDDWESDEVSRLVMGVKNGFVAGQTTRQIISDVVGAGGLSDISKRNALTIANTATAHIANEARIQTYKENDDVIQGYTLVVTLDSRTSTICRAWDENKVYRFTDKYQPMPPFHPNCRTTTAPALSSEYDIFDEGAVRAARGADGGQAVKSDTTYYSFLKNQPAAFQDEVLGKTKGLIFRNAGLSPEEFRRITVDDLGRPLTIEQMAARDKRVASYLRKTSN